MNRRAFLPLVASFVAFHPFGATLFAADAPRLSGPIVHDNLAIYLVHGAATAGAVPLTLQEALAKGTVKVHETGSVNELTVENVGNDEVFVQAGDIVKGGRQDRVLSVDLLLPPRSGQVSIAAFCVEHGRWSGRGKEDARQFASAVDAMPSLKAKMAMRAYVVPRRAAEAGRPCRPSSRARRRRRRAPAGNLVEREEDAGSTDSLGRRAGCRIRLAVEPAALARKREAQGGAGRLHQGAAGCRRGRQRYCRLRVRHQRQDQQRRCLRLERACSAKCGASCSLPT